MLHDTGLAVARLVALVVVTSIVSVVVLRLIHAATVGSIHAHLLHTARKHVRIVGAGLMGGTLGGSLWNTALGSTLGNAVAADGIIPAVIVKVAVHGRGPSWGVAHRCRGGSCGARSKRSGTGLQSRLDGRVARLFTADSSVVRRNFTTVTTMNGTGRNSAEAGIVIVEMLLGVGVGLRGRTSWALDSWDIIRRERAL